MQVVTIEQVCEERKWVYATSQRLSSEAFSLKNKIVEIQPPRIRKTPHLYSSELNGPIAQKNNLYQDIRCCIEEGRVHPSLEVVEVLDPNHPVRLATPPEQKCYSIRWKGETFISDERKVLGEYTGDLKYCGYCQGNEDYAFTTTFRSEALLSGSGTVIQPDNDVGENNNNSNINNNKKIGILESLNIPIKEKASKFPKRTVSRIPETGGRIVMDSENRLILPGDEEFVLDASLCGNEMALVNHYESVGLNEGRHLPINTQWTSMYYNGWPHILLWSVPGVPIKQGDEIVADFGERWFRRIRKIALDGMKKELVFLRNMMSQTDLKVAKRMIGSIQKTQLTYYGEEIPPLGTCEKCQMPNTILRTEASVLKDDYENQDESVVCDGCQSIYHVQCVNPWRSITNSCDTSAFATPQCAWYCPACQKIASEIIFGKNVNIRQMQHRFDTVVAYTNPTYWKLQGLAVPHTVGFPRIPPLTIPYVLDDSVDETCPKKHHLSGLSESEPKRRRRSHTDAIHSLTATNDLPIPKALSRGAFKENLVTFLATSYSKPYLNDLKPCTVCANRLSRSGEPPSCSKDHTDVARYCVRLHLAGIACRVRLEHLGPDFDSADTGGTSLVVRAVRTVNSWIISLVGLLLLMTFVFVVKAALMVSERKRNDLEVQLEGLKEGWRALGLEPGKSVPLFGVTAGKTEIKKCFEVGTDNRKFYKGKVNNIWAFRPKLRKGVELMAHIVYEDGDSEDLNFKELREIIESNVETKKFKLSDFRLVQDLESVPLMNPHSCPIDPDKDPPEKERASRLHLALRQISHLQRMTATALDLIAKPEPQVKRQGKVEKPMLEMWMPLNGLKRWARLKWNIALCCWRCYIPSLGLSRNFPVPIDSIKSGPYEEVSEGVEDAFIRATRWMTRRRNELHIPSTLNRLEEVSNATSDEEDSAAWSLDETEDPVRMITFRPRQLINDCPRLLIASASERDVLEDMTESESSDSDGVDEDFETPYYQRGKLKKSYPEDGGAPRRNLRLRKITPDALLQEPRYQIATDDKSIIWCHERKSWRVKKFDVNENKYNQVELRVTDQNSVWDIFREAVMLRHQTMEDAFLVHQDTASEMLKNYNKDNNNTLSSSRKIKTTLCNPSLEDIQDMKPFTVVSDQTTLSRMESINNIRGERGEFSIEQYHKAACAMNVPVTEYLLWSNKRKGWKAKWRVANIIENGYGYELDKRNEREKWRLKIFSPTTPETVPVAYERAADFLRSKGIQIDASDSLATSATCSPTAELSQSKLREQEQKNQVDFDDDERQFQSRPLAWRRNDQKFVVAFVNHFTIINSIGIGKINENEKKEIREWWASVRLEQPRYNTSKEMQEFAQLLEPHPNGLEWTGKAWLFRDQNGQKKWGHTPSKMTAHLALLKYIRSNELIRKQQMESETQQICQSDE